MTEGGLLIFLGILILFVIIVAVIAVVAAVSGAAAAIADEDKEEELRKRTFLNGNYSRRERPFLFFTML